MPFKQQNVNIVPTLPIKIKKESICGSFKAILDTVTD